MTKSNKILINSFLVGTIFAFIIIKYVNISCLSQQLFHIPCPGCGLTRAFRSLLSLNFIDAFKYNFLVYPIIICFIYGLFLIYKDLRYKENNVSKFYNFLFVKNFKIIILILIIVEIINLNQY